MRIVIWAGAPADPPGFAKALLRPDDVIIAADGGAAAAQACGVVPALVIGDLDSLSPEHLGYLEAQGVPVERHPRDKDKTDLHLALEAALAKHPEEIVVLGGLGGRLDHTLGNIALLTLAETAGVPMSMRSREWDVFLVRDELRIADRVGWRLSLVPLTPVVEGVTVEGVRYGLRDGILKMGETRGLSNEITAPLARVIAARGALAALVGRPEGSGPAP